MGGETESENEPDEETVSRSSTEAELEELRQASAAVEKEMLRQLHSDAQRVFDEELATVTEISEKANRLIQLNGVVLTVVLTGAIQLGNPLNYANVGTIIGVTLFVLSMVVSVFASFSKETYLGISEDDIQTMLSSDVSEAEYLFAVLDEGYTEWIRDVGKVAARKNRRTQQSLGLFLAGLTLFCLGVLIEYVTV